MALRQTTNGGLFARNQSKYNTFCFLWGIRNSDNTGTNRECEAYRVRVECLAHTVNLYFVFCHKDRSSFSVVEFLMNCVEVEQMFFQEMT